MSRCFLTPERWAQIEELFHRAAECDSKLRASLLDGACKGDEELRRVVEGLLASEESARDDMHAAVHNGLDAVMVPLIGETVSHYRILEGLGGGGMGLVYRAEDIKLGRQVALKFLPEESIKDPAALSRFEREARSASALEHPNICPIHEFGEHEGRPFLAMQLLKGQTLRELISAGDPGRPPLAVNQLLDLAIQIASGLEAAHSQGIIHRDIKPANIFVTTQGQAMILDFGLAKLFRGEATAEEWELTSHEFATGKEQANCELNAAARDSLLSLTGAAMGTAGYMSPEQARGERLDARTDLFSLGAVLYEMATGKMAFWGNTATIVQQAVLRGVPTPPARVNSDISPELERIVNKALEKERKQRYQSAAEIRTDLQQMKRDLDLARTPATTSQIESKPFLERFNAEVAEPRRSAGFSRTAKWAAHFTSAKRLALPSLFLGFLVLTVSILWANLRSPLPRVVDSAQITKDGSRKADATFKLVSDGNRLYFQEGSWDDTEQKTALWQVSTQGGATARIPISLRNPIAYDFSQIRSELLMGAGEFESSSNERPLWILPLPGGPPHRVADIVAHDACWAPDGRHLAFANSKNIFAADADGSEVRKLATPASFDFSFWIRFSPDGTRLRFSVGRFGPEKPEIIEMAADGSGLHRLPTHGGCCGTWSADGRYYYYKNGRDIWVLPERKSVFGRVELGIPIQLTVGPVEFGAPLPSTDGKYLFVASSELQPRIELVHHDSRSREFVPFLGGISAGELEVSPDGKWVTYTTFPESDLWRSKLDGSERLQLTFAPINAHEPRWSPDGKQILFTDQPHTIFVVPASGGAPRQLMPADQPGLIGAGAWLPDGNSIIFGRRMGCLDSSCLAIYRLDLKTQEVSKVPGSDGMIAARLSHDGHYLTALRTGQNKVMLYDLKTNRWSELAQGWGSIVWSHDSRFVYLHLKHEAEPAELVRISVPDGKVQRVLDLTDVTLGGLWPDWISLLPDDSPLLMLDKSTDEIYRLDLQYR